MNSKQKRVGKALYKPNCYILVSGAKRDMKETFGDFLVKAQMSFLYDAGDHAAEWEPEHGHIQIWHRCEEYDEGATEHYYYDFHNSSPMNWSQLAVSNNELPQAFHSGDYEYIFAVLEDWATDR